MKKTSRKFVLCAAVCAAGLGGLGGTAFAEKAPVYISPNNDGIQDNLEVPLKMKEKRYVKEWSFNVSNEDGEIVRTIGNKVALPDRITFKSFFKSLVAPKQGVEIPSVIIWNGFLDDGSVAPDGVYYYSVSASDDNGNSATTSKLQVIVDNTHPEIRLTMPGNGEKSFGEGAKLTFNISQSGSKEVLWTANITDAEGKVVRSYKWENSAPLSIEWDGTDDNKNIVSDGVYNYEITSTDLAGNRSDKALISNIIYSGEKPESTVSLSGSKYFSPKGNSKIKNVEIAVDIPEPKSKVNALTDWNVVIEGKKDGKVYKSYSNNGNRNVKPPKSIVFDGTDAQGNDLPEGEYVAKITAKYLNGFEPAPVVSPAFVVDNTEPKATVAAGAKVFNGNDKMEISQKQIAPEEDYTGEKDWTGTIVDADGKTVKTFAFGAALPDSIAWDGTDDSGNIAPDGSYEYVLTGTELSGNSGSYKTGRFTLDTSKTELMLALSSNAFSPNGDGSLDTITFKPVVKASSGIESYELKVYNAKGSVVKSFAGKGSLPPAIVWNGLAEDGTRTDGIYSAGLETVANSGTKATTVSQSFELDTVVPSVEIKVPYLAFSPDGIGTKQNIPVTAKSSVESKWTAEVRNARNAVVKTFVWQNSDVKNFVWDGTDDRGNRAENGIYSLAVSTKDAAGNSASATIKGINLDARAVTAFVTNDNPGFSPNGDGILDVQRFGIKTSLGTGIAKWNFDIVDAGGKTVKSWSEKDSANLPAVITWAGETNAGGVADGTFTGKLHVVYDKGNVVDAQSSSFICTANPPALAVRTAPKYFSPDNDGNDDDLFIQLKGNTIANLKNWSFTIYDRNGKQFWKTSGKSAITERIIWDGRGNNGELVQSAEDYPYIFTATDDLGMTSKVEGKINVDVLVVRDGDKLKMQVPSIIFRSDNADFGLEVLDGSGKVKKPGLTQAQAANNERVLKRIADILKKFGDYKVTVVGHANRLTDDPNEETMDNPNKWGPALIPLSTQRAQYVKDQLVKMGINGSRLTVDGKGGTEPVVDTKNKEVNWKNRRVEFILEK